MRLFLYISFPINLWAFFRVVRVFEPAYEHTYNLGYAFAAGAVILVFSLFESSIVFGFYLLVGLLLPTSWNGKKLLMALTTLSFMTSLWGALSQLRTLRFVLLVPIRWIIQFYYHPVQVFYFILGLMFLLLIIFPTGFILYRISRSDDLAEKMANLMEKIEVLGILYLSLNLLGVIFLIWRNLNP